MYKFFGFPREFILSKRFKFWAIKLYDTGRQSCSCGIDSVLFVFSITNYSFYSGEIGDFFAVIFYKPDILEHTDLCLYICKV